MSDDTTTTPEVATEEAGAEVVTPEVAAEEAKTEEAAAQSLPHGKTAT